MPGSYFVDVANRLVYTRAWGVLSFDIITAHAATLKADPRFDPGFRQIVDFRDVTEIALTSTEVREFAALTPFRRDAKRAFVVASDEAYGMVRMFGTYREADPAHLGIFRAIEPAMEWVGLVPNAPWPPQAPDKTFGKE